MKENSLKEQPNLIEKIVTLCKGRGFIFPSSEIYGGFSSSYDYGPLGAEMKNNIKREWWNEMTKKQENIVGLDAAILMSPKIWEASGHLTAGFADELVECRDCKKRFRVERTGKICPECGGDLTEPKKFNLMMRTFVGPVEDEAAKTYLRAETCQGIYMNFENILETMRLKIPFGVAQIGKAFRNEITPKDFIYRMREFEQMEMQWFCRPEETDKWFEYWKGERLKWYLHLGIKKENIRFREHKKEELAHYAREAVDIEYNFPFGFRGKEGVGWREIEGIHNRGDWDLSVHSKHSGKKLEYYDEEKKEKFIPHIIETSGGVDRSLLSFLLDGYEEVKGGRTKTTKATKETETVLRLHKSLAPVKVAVLPLVRNRPELVKKAEEVYQLLKPHFVCQYDEVSSIGRRYRRQDEISTPYCLTVDFESLEKNDVTIRDRDSMEQVRVKIRELPETLEKLLKNEIEFKEI